MAEMPGKLNRDHYTGETCPWCESLIVRESETGDETCNCDVNHYINYYIHCGVEWDDGPEGWDCTCNERCPKCNAEIEPYYSEEIDTEGNVVDEIMHVSGDWVPEGGWP